MLEALLRASRTALRRSILLRRIATAMGLSAAFRGIVNRRALRRGTHDLVFRNIRLRFRVRSAREVSRIDHVHLEAEVLDRLIGVLRDGDVLHDIGANIGVISIVAARACPGVTVHAFEPTPGNLLALRGNVEENGLSGRVNAHGIAISTGTGSMTMFVEPEVGDGQSSLVVKPGSDTTEVTVPTESVDDFARRIGRDPSVIKIDVEGAEWEVVRGMKDVLARRTLRHVLVEVHGPLLRQRGLEEAELLRPVLNAGFQETWRQQRGSELHLLLSRAGA